MSGMGVPFPRRVEKGKPNLEKVEFIYELPEFEMLVRYMQVLTSIIQVGGGVWSLEKTFWLEICLNLLCLIFQFIQVNKKNFIT